eukprot:972558-Pelagomonas_calceolata.AAC.1
MRTNNHSSTKDKLFEVSQEDSVNVYYPYFYGVLLTFRKVRSLRAKGSCALRHILEVQCTGSVWE